MFASFVWQIDSFMIMFSDKFETLLINICMASIFIQISIFWEYPSMNQNMHNVALWDEYEPSYAAAACTRGSVIFAWSGLFIASAKW